MEVPYGRFLGNLLFLFCLPCALAAKKNREVCRHRSNRVDWLLPCYFLSCGFHFQHSRRSFPEFFATCVRWVIVPSFWWFVVCFPGFFSAMTTSCVFSFFPFYVKKQTGHDKIMQKSRKRDGGIACFEPSPDNHHPTCHGGDHSK